MGLAQSGRLVATCLLLCVVFLALVEENGVEGRKRGKRERRVSRNVSELHDLESFTVVAIVFFILQAKVFPRLILNRNS